MVVNETIVRWIGSLIFLPLGLLGQPAFGDAVLQSPEANRAFYEERLPVEERAYFIQTEEDGSLLFENGYAQHQIKNTDIWPPQGIDARPTEVAVIFTQYPKDEAFWLTDYEWLLSQRLQALFRVDSAFNNASIQYKIILQTECSNEFEAMQLFHGIRVKYVEKVERIEEESKQEKESQVKVSTREEHPNADEIKRIKRFMVKEKYYMDSAVYEVLDRHTEWRKAAMVIDWTGSMYGYGAEAFLWHVINNEKSGIEQVFFFNDGDKKKKRRKRIGSTGGIYESAANPVDKPLKYFNKVKNKGDGGDSPENDVEALLYAVEHHPELTELILLADNRSCIRDFKLLETLQRPVRVILCGTERGINHQYINLAWKTKGSIHTSTFDLDLATLNANDEHLEIQGVAYTLTPDGLLLPTNRFDDRYGYCDRYYDYREKQ